MTHSAIAGHDGNALVVRPYTPADWAAVCRVHDAARVRELAAGGVNARAFRPMADVAERDEFFASQTLVACAGHEGVGFVSWRGTYVTWLYVAPAWQRLGIGRRLLAAALGRIGPEAWTSAIANNAPAVALYRAAGFELVEVRPGNCEGYPCTGVRLALPTSRMRNAAERRQGPATR